MTRGAIVLFTCLFSVLFLGRQQHAYHLVGVGLVSCGITMVSMGVVGNLMGEGNVLLTTILIVYYFTELYWGILLIWCQLSIEILFVGKRYDTGHLMFLAKLKHGSRPPK
jgi:hypothetical protein